ncbi:2-oxo-3-hexenedioate decarboxylase [Homoserinimonas aerilata]|uniref:2-oxo-3-hexenedioate decarboxylase n=1 Tax=Homoserinimonas aerilata TaxID=1162970 RepID=A0A542YGK2_9MICO|nr:fumarylacetoacetate hydrolase family protein [Homoserinimonas aerilata]TQL47104.1 2-oxo-3-hexenedioate decarboxylase [Homoserinimonas aerilata]
MPIVQISIVKGRDRGAITTCIKEVAQTVARTLGAPLASVRVMVNEMEPDFFAVGTTLKSETQTPDAAPAAPTPPTTRWTIDSAARHLLDAEADRRDVTRITDEWSELDIPTGYLVQEAIIRDKVANGDTVVGVKLGLTSRAKQKRMGIDSPLTAVVTQRMHLPAGVPVDMSRFIHPRIEPEIVFTMKHDLRGPGVTADAAMAAVGEVRAGFELIDSRYKDFSFALPDVIADNASSAGFYIGDIAHDPADLDLALEACIVRINGEVVDTATGAAVQGHPGEALALAANSLAARGQYIKAGDTVLTGGMTDAVFVNAGDEISAQFTNLGSIVVTA